MIKQIVVLSSLFITSMFVYTATASDDVLACIEKCYPDCANEIGMENYVQCLKACNETCSNPPSVEIGI